MTGDKKTTGLRQVIIRVTYHVSLVTIFLLAGCKKSGDNAIDLSKQPDAVSHTKNFASVEYYPEPLQRQVKSRLTGADAQPLAGGMVILIKQLKLEAFNTNGNPQAVVETPECIYDAQHDTANSAGHLQARNGDGKIRIEGDGFLWRRDDSFLTISNKVKTLIASIAIATTAGLGGAQTNSSAAANSTPRVTLIESAHGDFDMGAGRHQAIYSGNVRVSDPQMNLRCERLTADLPQTSGHPTNIVAQSNVVIDFADDRGRTNHATCDKAVYVFEVQNGVTNEMVTLTGHAMVQNPQMILTGEPIYLDLFNKTLHADNQKMVLRESMNGLATTNELTTTKINLPPGANTNFPPGKMDLVPPDHPGSSSIQRYDH